MIMETETKTIDDIFKELRKLVKSQGFLYVLLFTIEDDVFIPLPQIDNTNYQKRISNKEAAMLLGLLINENNHILEEPKDMQFFFLLKEKTYRLLYDLHIAMMEPFNNSMKAAINRLGKGKDPQFPTKEFIANATNQRETFFYSNEPAYDLEYLQFTPKKYKYDKEYLYNHHGFDCDEVITIATEIKSTFDERIKKYLQTPKEEIDNFLESDKRWKNYFQSIEDAKNYYYLWKYQGLVPLQLKVNDNNDYLNHVNCHDLCKILLDTFTIDSKFCSGEKIYQDFLSNFSIEVRQNVNTYFTEPGSYNVVVSRPIININSQCHLLPIPYLLFQSIYESPYYWFHNDNGYIKKAESHLGTASEDMVYDLLYPIFGKFNTYKGVIIKKGKTVLTDIDILCILGNKALCIQVKAKKLTEKAQTGNDKEYKKDFKCAIADAYQQGLSCREAILANDYDLYIEKKNKLDISKIEEVYILCLTTGFYTALPHQVRLLLKIEEDKPTPVVLNIFDLHLVTHYLHDPYEFLYYIRQRITTNDYFNSDNEIVLLSYHLSNRLWKNPQYNGFLLDQSIANAIDMDYGSIFGIKNTQTNERPALTCKWLSDSFRHFTQEIKNFKDPHVTDIIFDMYDFSGESERILSMIDYGRDRSLKNHTIVSMYIPFENGKFGITYTSSDSQDPEKLFNEMCVYTTSHKYKSKGDKWIGLASCVYLQTKLTY